MTDYEYDQNKRDRFKAVDATMPPPEKKEGYKTKHSVTTKLPMHLGTFDPRKKKKRGLNDEDVSDIGRYFGSSGAGVSKVDECTYYTDSQGTY
jgi:hypothetical protein